MISNSNVWLTIKKNVLFCYLQLFYSFFSKKKSDNKIKYLLKFFFVFGLSTHVLTLVRPSDWIVVWCFGPTKNWPIVQLSDFANLCSGLENFELNTNYTQVFCIMHLLTVCKQKTADESFVPKILVRLYVSIFRSTIRPTRLWTFGLKMNSGLTTLDKT